MLFRFGTLRLGERPSGAVELAARPDVMAPPQSSLVVGEG